MRTTMITGVTALMLATASGTLAQVSVNPGDTQYTQSFDTLANSGPNPAPWTNNSTLPGWFLFAANNLDELQPARILLWGTGSSNTGGVYSFGPNSSTNRTLGFLGSGTTFRMVGGLVLQNNTGNPINTISVQYTGRQWRQTTGPQNVMRFSYQIAPSVLTNFLDWKRPDDATPGTNWIDSALLNFAAPKFGTAVTTDGAIDGLAAGNFETIGPVNIGSLNWQPGEYLHLRFTGRDNPGNDQGYGLDDLIVSFGSASSPPLMASSVTNVPTLLTIGGTVGYSFITTNGGGTPGVATITATIPTNVNYLSTVGASGSFNNVTRELTITTPTIADSGGTAAFTVNLQPTIAFNPTPMVISWVTNPPNNQTVQTSTIVDNGTDLRLTGTHTFNCPANLGDTGSFTLTLENLGPNTANATVVLNVAPGVTITGLTPSAGSASNAGNVVTWTVPAFAVGSATLQIDATPTAPGAVRVTGSVSSNLFDPTLTNNSVVVGSNVNDTISAPKPVVFSSAVFSPSAQVPPSLGFDPFSTFSGTQFAFGRPFLSPDGSKGVMQIETTSSNGVALMTFDVTPTSVTPTGLAARRGVTIFADENDGVGTQNPAFDRSMAINNDGKVAFTTQTNNANTSLRRVLAISDSTGNAVVAARQNALLGGSFGGSRWGGTMVVAGITAAARATLYASLAGTNPAGQTRIVASTDLLNSVSQLLRSGVDIPANQVGATTFPWTDWQGSATAEPFRGVRTNADGTRYLAEGFIDNPPGGPLLNPDTNQIVVVDGQVVLQEGVVIPGSGFAEPIRPGSPFQYSFMENDGNWFAYGSNADPIAPAPNPWNAGQDWVVRNGVVIARTGDPITPSATEIWTDQPSGGGAGLARTFIMAVGRGDDVVIGGLTNIADSTRRAVLVWQNAGQAEVVLRTGDPVDLNGNGINDDDAYVNFIRDGRAAIDADRTLLVVVDLRNGNQVCTQTSGDIIGQALLRLPLPPVSGVVACNPADIAATDASPGADACVDNGDFSLFISSFFGADCTATCGILPVTPCNPADIGATDAAPGADGCVDNGDFSLFIASFFTAVCPDCNN
jgi:uncharacterized repeat protein (TIGR01451 family)